jgi:hypothetical protein
MRNATNTDPAREAVEPGTITCHKVRSLQATIQRVHYLRRELTVIGEGSIWRFVVPPGCRMWFNDTPANLRCFHPLDPVTVIFDENEQVVSIYSWERRALAA